MARFADALAAYEPEGEIVWHTIESLRDPKTDEPAVVGAKPLNIDKTAQIENECKVRKIDRETTPVQYMIVLAWATWLNEDKTRIWLNYDKAYKALKHLTLEKLTEICTELGVTEEEDEYEGEVDDPITAAEGKSVAIRSTG